MPCSYLITTLCLYTYVPLVYSSFTLFKTSWHYLDACVYAKPLQLCPTLCNLMDYGPPGFSVHGILQARILEWVAISFSRGSSWPKDWTRISCGSWIEGRFFTAEPPGKPIIWIVAINQNFQRRPSPSSLCQFNFHFSGPSKVNTIFTTFFEA